jgi:hypothetical protein
MKNKTLIVLSIALFCLSTAGILSAQENTCEALLGTWEAETDSGEFAFTFIFTLEEETLKGTYKSQSGTFEMQKLTFEDGTLKFTVDVGMVIDFTATIEDENMSGEMSNQYGETDIIGKKK